jgi:hypothetical protein
VGDVPFPDQVGDEESLVLSRSYETVFERTLQEVALAATELDVPLAPFWPIRGAAYDGSLLVIGRSVNGWVKDWSARQLREPSGRRSAVEWMRSDAEPVDGCRMRWVTDLWDARDGYSTHRSAFWRVLRRIVLSDTGPRPDDSHWSSRIAWTNLYKVSPGAGWNPGADLQLAQRRSAIELLNLELEQFAPSRVLALTGGWIGPFSDGLGLDLAPRSGLVEGVGKKGDCAWVVAKHPMAKPEDRFVSEVLAAFADLGAPFAVGSEGS